MDFEKGAPFGLTPRDGRSKIGSMVLGERRGEGLMVGAPGRRSGKRFAPDVIATYAATDYGMNL